MKKIIRLGFTETTLLFIHWYENISNDKNKSTHYKIINLKKNMINWLYTTSGYYDKTIIYNYMNVKHENDIDPETYNKYFEILLNFVKEADLFVCGIHYDKNNDEYKQFIKYLNVKSSYTYDIFYSIVKNRKILIISPFAELFKKQFDSGNCKLIDNDFPDIKKIYYYTNIYTFFNNGPHNNILETVNYLFADILSKINDNYDLVLISAGAYSNLLANKFYDYGKDVYTMGAELQKFFGVLNNREKSKMNLNVINKNLWIVDIPNEYKPIDYEKIENGCYW